MRDGGADPGARPLARHQSGRRRGYGASLLDKARALAADLPNVAFHEADGRSLPFEAGAFDVVIFDSTLSHVAQPAGALAQAFRVLRATGWLGVFDDDTYFEMLDFHHQRIAEVALHLGRQHEWDILFTESHASDYASHFFLGQADPISGAEAVTIERCRAGVEQRAAQGRFQP